jgi:hypothetical protein
VEVDETLDLIERGRLTVPEGGSSRNFVAAGGSAPATRPAQRRRRKLQERAEICKDLLQKDLCRSDSGPAADWECAREADCQRMTLTDSRLARLVEAWPSLPEHVVLAIIALVDSAGRVEASRLQPPS